MASRWDTDRRDTFPEDWYSYRRPAVIARDGGQCVQCGKPGNQVDHKGHRLDHRIEMLQLLCVSCHRVKTLEQARQATMARNSKRRRPVPKHPGAR